MRFASLLALLAGLLTGPGSSASTPADLPGSVYDEAGLEPADAEEQMASAEAALYLLAEGRLRWLSRSGPPPRRALAVADGTLAEF